MANRLFYPSNGKIIAHLPLLSRGLIDGVTALSLPVEARAVRVARAFVADASSAVKMRLRVGPQFDFPILASKSLADKTVMAIALPALCAVINATPQVSLSKQATIQMDNAPAAGGLVDSGGTVASAIRSAWQTDSVFARFTADIAWCLRADNACTWMTGINW